MVEGECLHRSLAKGRRNNDLDSHRVVTMLA